jgi:F0F1-type ATP synthase epsilon subunit
MSTVLRVIVQSPVAKVWEGEVVSLSAENSEGPFDILPDHARFMSLLEPDSLSIELPSSEVKSFKFTSALLYVDEDVATIYTQGRGRDQNSRESYRQLG